MVSERCLAHYRKTNVDHEAQKKVYDEIKDSKKNRKRKEGLQTLFRLDGYHIYNKSNRFQQILFQISNLSDDKIKYAICSQVRKIERILDKVKSWVLV